MNDVCRPTAMPHGPGAEPEPQSSVTVVNGQLEANLANLREQEKTETGPELATLREENASAEAELSALRSLSSSVPSQADGT